MSHPGDRPRKLAAAGVLLHQVRRGFAVCGMRREQGIEITSYARYVTCPGCRAVIQRRRAKAKATFAAITGGTP